MAKTRFETLQEMVKQNLDIRVSDEFVECKTVKQGGIITMGTDHKTILDLCSPLLGGKQKLHCMLVVVDIDQYTKIQEGKE